MNVLVKLPTKSRPAFFMRRAKEYLADPTASLLVSIDRDDPTMVNDEMLAWMDAQPRLKYRIGDSKNKVEACNDGLAEEPWTGIVVLGSDDMAVQRPDYADRIARLFGKHFPDGDGVLHLNDGRVGRVLATICICDRTYFDRDGWLYNPCYTSVFCDDEWQAVAQQRGRYAYVDEVILKHDWIGQHAPDALHRRNESYYEHDCRTFRARKAAGFPA